jgi:hypothetical protein
VGERKGIRKWKKTKTNKGKAERKHRKDVWAGMAHLGSGVAGVVEEERVEGHLGIARRVEVVHLERVIPQMHCRSLQKKYN